MNNVTNLKISAGVRLDTNRDSEVLNQFVRINLEDIEIIEGDQKDPLKAHKPEPAAIIKTPVARKIKEEKNEKQEQEKKLQQGRQEQTQQDQQQHYQQDEFPEQQQEDEDAEKQQRILTAQREKIKARLGQKLIYQELRKRKKKRKRPKPEEVYTDKDRAAAVNMGTKDIKQSLRIKRKLDRSKVLQIPDEAEPSTFLALGNCEMKRGDAEVALSFLNKALELNPAEKNCLVARSKCYLLLGQPDNGLKDAEAALAVDKHFIKGIYQKAEALYYLGDFEHSLMYYHRGLRIRPEHEGFQLGVRKAQKAIENAIGGAFPGVKRSPALSSIAKSSSGKSRTRESARTASSKITTKDTIDTKGTEYTTPKTSQRNTPMPRAKTASSTSSRLLRELKTDKEYLDHLLNHPDLKCKNKEDDSEIVGYIQEAVDFLKTRQEFWRQQMPNACK
ncbi:hypothetical protein ILUMI_27467 [Ignelater luminosus]|uniref:Outer dynein arm-docking complex subunit 4 n=1 Tax=Ignelater luminosus TaxID=2038154 RepID=A0A8K0FY51_IGNLU|nr:hypothetical protein ILUMI_27467 [Ignelater luminosus]